MMVISSSEMIRYANSSDSTSLEAWYLHIRYVKVYSFMTHTEPGEVHPKVSHFEPPGLTLIMFVELRGLI